MRVTPRMAAAIRCETSFKRRKFMRSRIAIVLLGALLVLSVAGCSKKEQATQTPPASTGQEAQQATAPAQTPQAAPPAQPSATPAPGTAPAPEQTPAPAPAPVAQEAPPPPPPPP